MSSNLTDLRQHLGAKKQVTGQDLVRMLDAVEEITRGVSKRVGELEKPTIDPVKAGQRPATPNDNNDDIVGGAA